MKTIIEEISVKEIKIINWIYVLLLLIYTYESFATYQGYYTTNNSSLLKILVIHFFSPELTFKLKKLS